LAYRSVVGQRTRTETVAAVLVALLAACREACTKIGKTAAALREKLGKEVERLGRVGEAMRGQGSEGGT
jgi:hypothetical protein